MANDTVVNPPEYPNGTICVPLTADDGSRWIVVTTEKNFIEAGGPDGLKADLEKTLKAQADECWQEQEGVGVHSHGDTSLDF